MSTEFPPRKPKTGRLILIKTGRIQRDYQSSMESTLEVSWGNHQSDLLDEVLRERRQPDDWIIIGTKECDNQRDQETRPVILRRKTHK